MSFNLKSILTGLFVGIFPGLFCFLLLELNSTFNSKELTPQFSFGIMGLYALLAIAVFVIAMILILIKNKPVIGGIVLLTMIIQLILGVSYMASV